MFHWLTHVIGWNHGTIETWWEGDKLMVGFRCNCGKLEGIDEVPKYHYQ